MTEFEFKSLTDKDIESYVKDARVFNMSRESIEKEKIVLASFSDEKLGDSEEKLDIAIFLKNKGWKLLDIDDKIKSYNEIPLGYLLQDIDYDRVLVVIRRMSNMILDKSDGNVSMFIYCVVSPEFKGIENNPSLIGSLARHRIYLDGTYKEVLGFIDKHKDVWRDYEYLRNKLIEFMNKREDYDK